jgi:hypothetical protein
VRDEVDELSGWGLPLGFVTAALTAKRIDPSVTVPWSRAQRGSRNHAEAVRRLRREHAQIAHARRTFLHQISSQLVKHHARLVVGQVDSATAN